MTFGFVDSVVVYLKAGDGGDGCVAVRREKFKPLAGPDGGSGGNGADIIFHSTDSLSTLLNLKRKPHISASNGKRGLGSKHSGANADDIIIDIPSGTVIYSSSGEKLIDMSENDIYYCAAKGGIGGKGNFALADNKRKAPGFALLGTKGEEKTLTLEFKTIADVGLVGFPSAGKSSVIASISASKAKIADYPFTTLSPNIGVVYTEGQSYSVADIPGIIEGAHAGKGLGLEFLKHIDRCSVLVHIIDMSLNNSERNPLRDFEKIMHELSMYKTEGISLDKKPMIIALNKSDVKHIDIDIEKLKNSFKDYELCVISAATHSGIDNLKKTILKVLNKVKTPVEMQKNEADFKAKIKDAKDRAKKKLLSDFEVKYINNIYEIYGDKPEIWIEQTMFNNNEAVGFLADRLKAIGIEDKLLEMGCQKNDRVKIGNIEFQFNPDISSSEIISQRGEDIRLQRKSRPSAQKRKESENIDYE